MLIMKKDDRPFWGVRSKLEMWMLTVDDEEDKGVTKCDTLGGKQPIPYFGV